MTCPHCRNTGYDASGYPCTCGLPDPDDWQEYVLGLFALVALIITVVLLTIKLIPK